MSLNPPHFTLTNTNSMPTSVMISLLRKGQNGAQILEILDSICEDNEQQKSTANVVNFSGAQVTDF